MIDWLVIWGVSEIGGSIFKDIFLPLAKGALEDYTKEFFKDCISDFTNIAKPESLKKATGKALKEFLILIQDEIITWSISKIEFQKKYGSSLKSFVYNDIVKQVLGKAFDLDCKSIDAKTLENQWIVMSLPNLPEEFDWNQVSQQYLRKVRTIIRETEDLREILNLAKQESICNKLEEVVGISPEFNIRKYQESIKEQYGNIQLDSLDVSGYAYNELKLWKMFIPQNVRELHDFIPQIYEIPKEYQRQLKEDKSIRTEISPEQIEECRKNYYSQKSRLIFDIFDRKNIEEEVNGKYVVILGDPGSGKSTLLQYIALEWAELSIRELSYLPIPLLIELRTYVRSLTSGKCNGFLEFFHKASGITCHLNQIELHDKLKSGNALVMFDGLDEIFDPAQRNDVTLDIHRFTNDYPNVQVIVTSRVIGYKPQKLHNAGFQHYMLQDLESYQIDDFVYRWHDLNFKEKVERKRKRDRFEKAISESKAIRELAGNPLLLTMMAILNRNQELPRDRAELYNQSSRVLLHQWDVERALIEDHRLDPKTIDYKDKQGILRHVACYMQTSVKDLAGNYIHEQNLEIILRNYLKSIEIINSRDISKLLIHQLRTRNFILCFLGDGYYAFVHRTFLEYFCAWEFVWQFKEIQILSVESLKKDIFGSYWKSESWHEVLRLIAGMIDAKFVGEIIDYLISLNGSSSKYMNLFLAADCLSEVRNQSSIIEIKNRLFTSLCNIINADNIDKDIVIKGISIIYKTWKNDEKIWYFFEEIALSNTSEYIISESIMAIAKCSIDNSNALSVLKKIAKSGNVLATLEFAQICTTDSEIINLICSLAQSGNQVAIEKLVRTWGDDPNSFPILINLVTSVNDTDLRDSIIKSLANNWKHEIETLSIIKNLAISGIPTAITELAWTWEDNPETLPVLMSLADSGNPTAIAELALGWGDNYQVLQLLERFILSTDPHQREERRQTLQNPILKIRNFVTRNQFPNYENYEKRENNDNSLSFEEILMTALTRFSDDSTKELLAENLTAISIEGNIKYIAELLYQIKTIKHREKERKISRLRTKLTDPMALFSAIRSLGITAKLNADIRSENGEKIEADVVAILEGDYDLGWLLNTEGNLDLIADLRGIAKKHNQTELINLILQRYNLFTMGYRRFLRDE